MSRIHNRHGKDKDETTEVEDLLVVRDAQRNTANVYAGEGCSGITTKTIGEPTGKHFGGEDL
ncbi:hypothetical protein F2Q70_00007805 [Brassica cretica]|uniref:Uncharacterized protein n=1 Tax=Brassica cretica TaxID=69181 RepID=A0A8S9LYX5_BRACR|nr:hypothetical protein F2Q70_00007805 [Brassica cretica]